jgi:sRNA-binding carbon storage regulator CsrA
VLSVKKEDSVYLVDTVSGSVTRVDIFLREGKIGITADPRRVQVIRGSIAEKPILDRLKEQSQC